MESNIEISLKMIDIEYNNFDTFHTTFAVMSLNYFMVLTYVAYLWERVGQGFSRSRQGLLQLRAISILSLIIVMNKRL